VTDLELVELARRGDAEAFGELVDRHHRAALRAAVAALGSPDDADDAVQEAWLAARDRLGSFRGDAAFRTWLLSIVWNKARDRRRGVVRWLKRRVALEGPTGLLEAPGTALALVPAAPGRSPERAALDEELRRTVGRLVRTLPAKLRDPLLLIGSGDYSYDEVAAMLDQPVGTIKWRVSAARRQVRMKLTRLGL
jgi:RNA polymerase sigma-70 factor (ECF subfamily)